MFKNVIRYFKHRRNINNDEYWTPYEMGVELEVGDYLMFEKKDVTTDYIAASMGFQKTVGIGKKLFKIVGFSSRPTLNIDGTRCILGCGGDKISGNILTVPHGFMSDKCRFAMYYRKNKNASVAQ